MRVARHPPSVVVLIGACLILTGVFQPPALAQQPDNGNGRYTMTPVDGGFIRLDTQTGGVALCTGKDQTWSCEPLPDRSSARTGNEASRLETENRELRDRVQALEDRLKGAPSPTEVPPVEAPNGKTQMPSEQEIDQALDYVERVFKKLRDRVQKYQSPSPLPDTAPSPAPESTPKAAPGSGAL